ncbi:VPLPA-CTERM sorting domain-containing protein [Marinobacterium mangrovicola]|uniref:Putative secreted protein n=1 Tax=Marinobacterium mangrovicola TaxID=1476959 RepID=A0A4V2PD88_9GAMM|nr:VPLPA-CTERM sorting domain-containing protein [Marinobacterium mangrovicola]TCK04226.1 putative secreted protein [Marinobacterium mangrovicola]
MRQSILGAVALLLISFNSTVNAATLDVSITRSTDYADASIIALMGGSDTFNILDGETISSTLDTASVWTRASGLDGVSVALDWEQELTINGIAQSFFRSGEYTITNTQDSFSIFSQSASFDIGSGIVEVLAYAGDLDIFALGTQFVPLTYDFTYTERLSAVPVPAAAWLFGTALLGLAAIRRKKLKEA